MNVNRDNVIPVFFLIILTLTVLFILTLFFRYKKKNIPFGICLSLSLVTAFMITLSSAFIFSHNVQYMNYGLHNKPDYYWEVYGWPFTFFQQHDYWPEQTLSIERKLNPLNFFLNLLIYFSIIFIPWVLKRKLSTKV